MVPSSTLGHTSIIINYRHSTPETDKHSPGNDKIPYGVLHRAQQAHGCHHDYRRMPSCTQPSSNLSNTTKYVSIHTVLHMVQYIQFYIQHNTYSSTYSSIHTVLYTAQYIQFYIRLNTYSSTYSSIHTVLHMTQYIQFYIRLNAHSSTYGSIYTQFYIRLNTYSSTYGLTHSPINSSIHTVLHMA